MYIRWVMATLNHVNGDYAFSDDAFEATKELLLELFPYVARSLTSAEVSRIEQLGEIPAYLGGLGYEG